VTTARPSNARLCADVDAVRAAYPALRREQRGRPPIYFDNAATVLKPQPVIDAVCGFLSENGSNVHRGIHYLSIEGSHEFEGARDIIARYIGAQEDEIVFVRNATEGINVVARSLPARSRVLVTGMEHHSNLVPWQALHDVEVVPLEPDGTVDAATIRRRLAEGFDLLAVCHVSNVLGVINPVADLVAAAHEHGARILIDAAQSVPHLEVDVPALQSDYLAFSGHKIGGPTGIGVLHVRRELLADLEPVLFGGNMVSAVTRDDFTLQAGSLRLEAGTPAIEGTLGLAAACEFLDDIGLDVVERHERALREQAYAGLAGIPGITLHGPGDSSLTAGVVAFSVAGMRPDAVAQTLSERANVCVRSGYLCSQPTLDALGIGPAVRASFFVYNTPDEVDAMIDVLASMPKVR